MASVNSVMIWALLSAAPMAFGQPPAPAEGEFTRGRFLRLWWFEAGIEHGNPMPNPRFRVNAPEVVLHPSFAYRSEVRASGMMQLRIQEDLRLIEGAELYLELWGGHPGTANKRFTVNGRSTYKIPEVGTEQGHCTHQYPRIKLKRTDLVSGYNAIQFACDQGKSFWGHFIVDNACLRIELPRSHPDLAKAGLTDFDPRVDVFPGPGPETFTISLQADASEVAKIARVDYWGFYEGYDENGDGVFRDWHGFTKNRLPTGHLGSAFEPPFRLHWDLAMLPAQRDMAVRATITLKDRPNLTYETAAVTKLVHQVGGAQVRMYGVSDKPVPFWSRAGKARTAKLELDLDPSRIERAELHTVVWDGGRGSVADYFTLNGRAFPVAAEGKHDVIYTVLPVPPDLLRRGRNEIRLLSDTEHHGIEILEPGPTLVVRYR